MSSYVDGFLIVLPKKNLAAYRKMAKVGCKIWMKHGALDYKECVGEDLTPDMGPEMKAPLSFPKLTKLKPDETVVFAYIVFKSRAHRDKVNAKVMKDPDMSPESMKDMEMPFDMKRFSYGGFEVIVEA
jgi:uncharacterized protein YbaA (DUF1428 family)